MTATGGSGGMGIGGYGSEEPFVNISGGTVTAKSASGGAGIGGVQSGRGGVINISGGTVFAQGSSGGAAIGGSFTGSSGTITISGGTVYAGGDPSAANDIGSGIASTTGTLTINGTARVFLKNDSSITPTTTHTHLNFTEDTDEVYGSSVPAAWTTFGAYLRFYTLSYHANNGVGMVPASANQFDGTATTVSDGSGLTRAFYQFNGWNTAADGSGASYSVGNTFTFADAALLYAQWTAQPKLASSNEDAKVYTGGRIVLTPNIDGGTWNWDKAFFSATFNSPATFTALKAGASTITYTVEGQSTSYAVTIKASELPATGQDFAWEYTLCILAAIMLAAAFIIRKRKA